MKRSVAILGPTPQFLRWSIGHRCQLRQLDSLTPNDTFRQLRGIREFSTANSEGRVFKDVCIHASASRVAPEEALGFFASEVLDVYGGADSIEQCCNSCPANTNGTESDPPSQTLWAGCYGWLAIDGSSMASLASTANRKDGANVDRDAPPEDDLLVRETEHVIQMLNLQPQIRESFPHTSPAWFGFWQSDTLTEPQLLLLEQVLSAVLCRHETNAHPQFVDDLLRLIDAISLAHRHRLPLLVELIPRGYSDGQRWTIAQHCAQCGLTHRRSQPRWTSCPACSDPHSPTPSKRFKVLGLRPYVKLSRVMGIDQTKELLEQYEAHQNHH